MRRRVPLLAVGSLVAFVLSSCGSPHAFTVEFDGQACALTTQESDSDTVLLINRGSHRVWIGGGAVTADATFESMVGDIRDMSAETVMALMTMDEAGFADHLEPGEMDVEPFRPDHRRFAIWCVTPPDGSGTAQLVTIVEP